MYSCTICEDINFTSPELFYNHLIEHKSKHSCKKCGKIIILKNHRWYHTRQHARVLCKICNTVYEKLNKEEHLQSHEYLYSIDQLNGIVDIINEMQNCEPSPAKRRKPAENIVQYQGTEPNCPVKNCGEKFGDQNSLINHFINHRKNHLCQYCGDIFPNDRSYESHRDDKICRAYSCLKCGKEFSLDRFIQHITSECDNKNLFDNLDVEPMPTYNNRKIYRISDETQYRVTCFACEEEFDTLDSLNTHLETHSKKLNICAKCFCVFDTEQEFQDHTTITGCENTEKDLPAEILAKLTNEITEFNESHARNTDHFVANKKVYEMSDDSVLFQCNVCESKFVKFAFLKEHSAKYNHEIILCFKCLYLFNSWHEHRKHFCVIIDYSSFHELEFRKHLKQYLKRKIDDDIPVKKDNTNILDDDDDDELVKRMSMLIHKLKNIKFKNLNVNKTFKETPSSSSANVKSNNDDYDLNKILPRILERRNKRLFQKPNPDDDSEEELEIIGNDLQDLDICKKHLLIENTEYDLDKVLPRIMKLRHKRHIDEAVDDIDKFLEDLGSPQNQEPPSKRNKSDDDSEDTSDYFVNFESLVQTIEESVDEPSKN